MEARGRGLSGERAVIARTGGEVSPSIAVWWLGRAAVWSISESSCWGMQEGQATATTIRCKVCHPLWTVGSHVLVKSVKSAFA